MKRESDNQSLTAELDRLQKGDADHINSVRTIQAVARPDLSYGAYPDLALERFWEVTTFCVRPGFEVLVVGRETLTHGDVPVLLRADRSAGTSGPLGAHCPALAAEPTRFNIRVHSGTYPCFSYTRRARSLPSNTCKVSHG